MRAVFILKVEGLGHDNVQAALWGGKYDIDKAYVMDFEEEDAEPPGPPMATDIHHAKQYTLYPDAEKDIEKVFAALPEKARHRIYIQIEKYYVAE